MDFSCVVESQTCLVCHERIIFPSKLKSIFCTLSSNLCGIYRIYTYSMISKGGRTDTNLIAQYSMVWIWSFDIWVYISLTRRLVYCPLCLPLTTTSLMLDLCVIFFCQVLWKLLHPFVDVKFATTVLLYYCHHTFHEDCLPVSAKSVSSLSICRNVILKRIVD